MPPEQRAFRQRFQSRSSPYNGRSESQGHNRSSCLSGSGTTEQLRTGSHFFAHNQNNRNLAAQGLQGDSAVLGAPNAAPVDIQGSMLWPIATGRLMYGTSANLAPPLAYSDHTVGRHGATPVSHVREDPSDRVPRYQWNTVHGGGEDGTLEPPTTAIPDGCVDNEGSVINDRHPNRFSWSNLDMNNVVSPGSSLFLSAMVEARDQFPAFDVNTQAAEPSHRRHDASSDSHSVRQPHAPSLPRPTLDYSLEPNLPVQTQVQPQLTCVGTVPSTVQSMPFTAPQTQQLSSAQGLTYHPLPRDDLGWPLNDLAPQSQTPELNMFNPIQLGQLGRTEQQSFAASIEDTYANPMTGVTMSQRRQCAYPTNAYKDKSQQQVFHKHTMSTIPSQRNPLADSSHKTLSPLLYLFPPVQTSQRRVQALSPSEREAKSGVEEVMRGWKSTDSLDHHDVPRGNTGPSATTRDAKRRRRTRYELASSNLLPGVKQPSGQLAVPSVCSLASDQIPDAQFSLAIDYTHINWQSPMTNSISPGDVQTFMTVAVSIDVQTHQGDLPDLSIYFLPICPKSKMSLDGHQPPRASSRELLTAFASNLQESVRDGRLLLATNIAGKNCDHKAEDVSWDACRGRLRSQLVRCLNLASGVGDWPDEGERAPSRSFLFKPDSTTGPENSEFTEYLFRYNVAMRDVRVWQRGDVHVQDSDLLKRYSRGSKAPREMVRLISEGPSACTLQAEDRVFRKVTGHIL